MRLRKWKVAVGISREYLAMSPKDAEAYAVTMLVHEAEKADLRGPRNGRYMPVRPLTQVLYEETFEDLSRNQVTCVGIVCARYARPYRTRRRRGLIRSRAPAAIEEALG